MWQQTGATFIWWLVYKIWITTFGRIWKLAGFLEHKTTRGRYSWKVGPDTRSVTHYWFAASRANTSGGLCCRAIWPLDLCWLLPQCTFNKPYSVSTNRAKNMEQLTWCVVLGAAKRLPLDKVRIQVVVIRVILRLHW